MEGEASGSGRGSEGSVASSTSATATSSESERSSCSSLLDRFRSPTVSDVQEKKNNVQTRKEKNYTGIIGDHFGN